MVSSANFRSLIEGSLDVQSSVYREKSTGESTSADGAGAGCVFSQPH